jgi:hypothetical protein
MSGAMLPDALFGANLAPPFGADLQPQWPPPELAKPAPGQQLARVLAVPSRADLIYDFINRLASWFPDERKDLDRVERISHALTEMRYGTGRHGLCHALSECEEVCRWLLRKERDRRYRRFFIGREAEARMTQAAYQPPPDMTEAEAAAFADNLAQRPRHCWVYGSADTRHLLLSDDGGGFILADGIDDEDRARWLCTLVNTALAAAQQRRS